MADNRLNLIVEITKRADEAKLLAFDRISLIMDLECADREFGLRLEDLLAADDFNFAHDICGIQRHINRRTKKMDDFFVPRFATPA